MRTLGIAETTRRLLRGRIEFTYDALRGGRQWHVVCDGHLLCGKPWRATKGSLTVNHLAGHRELPTPVCYRCFVAFNSPTVVVLR